MARTASYPVRMRRHMIASYCKKNHPVTFKQVLSYAVENRFPELPRDPDKQEYVVRSDLYKLREKGVIKPEWVVVKNTWTKH